MPSGLRLATFDIDATPPVGSWLAYDSTLNKWDLGLRAKGIVLLGAGQPVVLCSVDWIRICNAGYDSFRQSLANAAGTTPDRVTIHTVHQHDAPWCDFTAEKILRNAKADLHCFDGTFSREFIRDLALKVRNSLDNTQPVTHIGMGSANVVQVASNRRIMGENGKLMAPRWTATKDSALRAQPEGLIDPEVSLVSFWDNDKPLAVLSYYATHPQSYYRTGVANPDFPGIARFFRQLAVPDALHIHFTGAGANVGAGKYNDGSHENRLILAERLADGMKRAWESTVREPVTAGSVKWDFEQVILPDAAHLSKLEKRLKEVPDTAINQSLAMKLAWIERGKAGMKVDVSCLSIGSARILHLPGELFVEYQLAAKDQRKDLFVAMAAYGDNGMGYIGTAAAYEEGGYETGEASLVSPDSEKILMDAITRLLQTK
ncbi:MAG TPA: hypothetical protein DDW27_06745 [Bacteroidales bacterium]|nr:hypothetical protein [Bacteroidales bacterium]